MKLIKYLSLSCLLFSTAASAGYDANVSGKVTSLLTYPSGKVLFSLDTQPTEHNSCNRQYFALAANLPEQAMSRMYARLLTAYSTEEKINIGYDAVGDCASNYIRTHRVG